MSFLKRVPDECRYPYLSPSELAARLAEKGNLLWEAYLADATALIEGAFAEV